MSSRTFHSILQLQTKTILVTELLYFDTLFPLAQVTEYVCTPAPHKPHMYIHNLVKHICPHAAMLRQLEQNVPINEFKEFFGVKYY